MKLIGMLTTKSAKAVVGGGLPPVHPDWGGPDGLIALRGHNVFAHRPSFLRACAEATTIEGDWAEFGVARGASAQILLGYLPAMANFYLFDSYQGLPEPWPHCNCRQGKFACSPPEFSDKRVGLVTGLFEDTTKGIEAQIHGPFSLIHIDSDLYSSAITVLTNVNPLIVTSTIIIFDEIWGYDTWRDDEYRALMEWAKEFDRTFEYILRDSYYRGAIRVTNE